MAFVSIPDDFSNTIRLIKIDGRFIPVEQLAYFGPVPSRDIAGGVKSRLHLVDGSVLSIFSFAARETVEPFGTAYLPKDDIAIARTCPNIRWSNKVVGKATSDALVVFNAGNLQCEPFDISVKTPYEELSEIFHSRSEIRYSGYLEYPNGIIIPVDFRAKIKPILG